MTPEEIERLGKLLSLTASTVDGEALAAIRMANKYIVGLGLTWTTCLLGAQAQQVNNGNGSARAPSGDPTIPEMFEVVFQNLRQGSAQDFIQSLLKQYSDRGSLSKRQVDALGKFYQNAVDALNQ